MLSFEPSVYPPLYRHIHLLLTSSDGYRDLPLSVLEQLRHTFQLASCFLPISSSPPALNDLPVDMAYGLRKPRNRVRVAARIPLAVCTVNVLPQASAFCALPIEMKLDILERLGDIERTYLAVTCKKMAQDVDSYVDIKAAKSRQQQLPTPRTPSTRQKLGFLWHMQNEQWVKKGRYKLCVDCARFKPKSGNWGGDSKLLKRRKLSRDVQIKGPHCPRCVERNQIAEFNRQRAMSRMVKLANAS